MPDLSIPNDFVADTDATAEDVNENFTAVRTAFNDSVASVLADTSSPARIVVVNGSGVPAYAPVTGAVSIDNAGEVSLGNNSVTALHIGTGEVGASEIATDAVGTLEIATDAVVAENIGSLPGVILEKSSTQSIPDATATAVEWQTEIIDTDTLHAGGADNAKITATTPGVYLFTATVVLAPHNTGRRHLSLWGSTAAIKYFGGMSESSPSNTEATILTATGIAKLAATQYVEARVKHNRGAALDLYASSNDSPWGNAAFSRFSAYWLGEG